MDKYRIISSRQQQANFKSLCEQARAEGRLTQAAQTAKQMMAQIESDPHRVGELLFHLQHMKWPVRHVARTPWSFHIAIDDERRCVYLGELALMGMA